jgi:hypothetical protein
MSKETLQLLNTAVIKRKEQSIRAEYDERLQLLGNSPALEVMAKAIQQLADQQKITRDQAALLVIELIIDLNQVWDDYISMEGIDQLKKQINGSNS